MDESKEAIFFFAGFYFILDGTVYPNNSRVDGIRRGEGPYLTLQCRTDNVNCCGTPPNAIGRFYYPNGTIVTDNPPSIDVTWGEQVVYLNGHIFWFYLHVGKFRCEIPDASGETKNIYISISPYFN